MRRSFVVVLVLLFSLPFFALAQTNFNGAIVPENIQTCAAGWRGLVQLLGNVVSFALALGVFICVLMITYAGALFVLNPTNPENLGKGRKVLTNAGVGLVIALAAWLIINALLVALGARGVADATSIFGGGDYCIQPEHYAAPTPRGDVTGGTPPDQAGGSCPVPASGACSVASLSNTCFASRGAQASQVCQYESGGGNVYIESGSDILADGNSYSIGLWQINLTTTRVGGLNCPAAFSGGGKGCQGSNLQGALGHCVLNVVDNGLYQQCKAKAKDPTVNTEAACSLYSSRWPSSSGIRELQPWVYTTTRVCHVPLYSS